MRRWAVALALLPVLTGCQAIATLVFPTQELQLLNQSTATVTVRVGAFKAGAGFVAAADALETMQLAPQASQSVSLHTGHYAVYAEANTDAGEDAATDVTLSGGSPKLLTLGEHLEDRTGDHTGPGYQVRQLGWN